MPSSDNFKKAIKAGKLRDALVLAMNEAIELKITTWVSSAADTAIAPQPGKRLHTRINLVDGDIENEIGDRFIGTGAYKELRQFHCEQVALANQTIQGNLESLQQLFAVLLAWQRSNLNLDQGNIEISDLEMRLLASGAAIEEVAPITEVDFVDLADSPELSSDLTSTELVSEISDAEEEEEEDWEDDDDITDFFASLPLDEEEETKLSSDEIEADLNREELSASLSRTEASLDQQSDLDKQTNLAAPTPEMPVSDLEIEDWEESVPVYSPPETSEVSPARDSTTSTDSESLVASEEKPLFAQDTPTTAEESEIGDRDLEDWGSFLEAELSETEAESEQLSTQTVVSSPVSTTDWEDSDLFDEELSPQETAAEIASWNLREAEDRPLRETDLATETLAEVEAGDELLSDESTDSTATNFASWELEEEATSTTSDLDFDAETALFAEDSVTESDLQSEELNEETTTTFSAPENLTEDPQVGVSEEDDWLDLEQETDSPDAENTDLFDSENLLNEASSAIVSEEDDWLDSEEETDSPDAENTDLFDSENLLNEASPAIVSEEDDWLDSEQEIDSPNTENADLFDSENLLGEDSPAIVLEEDDWIDLEQEIDSPDSETTDLFDSPAIVSEQDDWLDSEPEIDSPDAETTDLFDSESLLSEASPAIVSEEDNWLDSEQEIDAPDAETTNLFDSGNLLSEASPAIVSEEDNWLDSEQEIDSPDAETTDLFDSESLLSEASPAIVSEEDDWLDSEQETDAPDAENGDLVDSPAIISEEDNWIDSEPEIDSPNAENSDLNDFLDSNLGDDDWGDLDGEIPSSDADFNDSPATNLGDDDWGDLLDLQDEEETETSAPDEVESIAESEEWKDILDLQDEEAEDAEVSPFANELTPENELASDGQITTEEDAEESPFANELTPENELASDGQITTEEDAEESPFANELTPEATDLSLNENEAEYSPFAQPNLNVDDTESNLLPEDELEDWGEMTSGELSAGEAFAEIESLNLDSEENDWENWVVEEEPSELNNIPQLEVDPLEAFNLEEDEEWEDWIVEEETNSATNLTPETATGDRSLPNLDTLDWEDNDDWEDFEEVSQGTTSPPPASISTSDDDWDELTIDIEAQDVAELSQENESNLGSDFSSFDDDELRKGLTAAKYQKRPSQAEDDANQDSTPGG